MIATFFKNIKTMSGKCSIGNMVFGSFKNDSICIARNYVYPRLTEQNEIQAEKMLKGITIWRTLSSDFIKDLAEYTKAYNTQHQNAKKLNLTAYNMFMKVVLSFSSPINNKEELINITGNNLNRWIYSGFLPRVTSDREFTSGI